MGLSFTNIKDVHGGCLILIHGTTTASLNQFQELFDEIGSKTDKQVVLLSAKDQDASKIIQFYQLRGSHFALIIRDDDQLYKVWSDGEKLDAGEIIFYLNQVG